MAMWICSCIVQITSLKWRHFGSGLRFSETKTLVSDAPRLQYLSTKTRDSLHHPAIPQHGNKILNMDPKIDQSNTLQLKRYGWMVG